MADTKPTAEEETAATSSVENQLADDSADDEAVEGSQPQSEEDDAAGSSTQTRIRRLSADKKAALEEAEYWKQRALQQARDDEAYANSFAQNQNVYSGQAPAYQSDEVERAYSTLKNRGMVTKDDLVQVVTRIQWDRMHDKNETDVNRRGSKLPHYDRDEVEAHARKKNIPDPLAAYRDLYFDEIMDSQRRSSTNAVTSQKPSKPNQESSQPLDVDSFREKLSGPDGRKFYEELTREDPEKLDEILRQLNG